MPLWTMDPFHCDRESTLTLQEMIDCDIQSDFDGVLGGTHFSCPVQTLDIDSPSAGNFHLDSELPGDNLGNMTWLRQENLCNYVDLEATGLLVNPQTGLPIHSNNNHPLYANSKATQQHASSPSPTPTTDTCTPLSEVGLPAIKGAPNQNATLPVSSGGTVVAAMQRKEYPKPTYSYSCLIAMALRNSETGSLPVSEIYSFMTENFPYFKTAPNGWKNSVRHNLSLNKCFEKVEKPSATNTSQRKGCLWALNPAKINKLDEEVQKWSRKDPALIRRSMSHPENFEHFEKGLILQRQVKRELPLTPTANISSPANVTLTKVKGEPTDGELDVLGTTITLDTSLPDLNLQSGIWDELDEQMQFGVSVANDDSPTVSVTLTAASVRPMYRLSDSSAQIVG